MSRFVTRRLSRFTGVDVTSSLPLTTVPLSRHRLTEQERQDIIA